MFSIRSEIWCGFFPFFLQVFTVFVLKRGTSLKSKLGTKKLYILVSNRVWGSRFLPNCLGLKQKKHLRLFRDRSLFRAGEGC